MGKIRREENALWSFAPHDISVILKLTGELPIQVSASGGAYIQPNIADVTVSNLLFDHGVRAHIFVSWLHPYKEQRLVVIGSKQMIVFEDSRPDNKLMLFDKRIEWKNGAFEAGRPEGTPVPFAAEEPLRRECVHFLWGSLAAWFAQCRCPDRVSSPACRSHDQARGRAIGGNIRRAMVTIQAARPPLALILSYTMNSDERMQRESNLIATIRRQLPEFAKTCAGDSELVVLHQDSFAADYQEDEYSLLGMAIKYAGLRGKEVRVIGKNRSTLGEADKVQ
jgi:hypothetical protein